MLTGPLDPKSRGNHLHVSAPAWLQGRLRRALWWSILEPLAPRAQDQTSQPSVRGNKGRWNPFVNTSVTTRETDKPRVQPSFPLLHTNSGRKTTSLPLFFFQQSSFLVTYIFKDSKSSRSFLHQKSQEGVRRPKQPVQAALEVIKRPEEMSRSPHRSLPQVFMGQLCLREGSGTRQPPASILLAHPVALEPWAKHVISL